MNPIGMILGAGALGGLGYWGYKKLSTPRKEDYQTMPTIGQGGIPIMIATPIAQAVTVAQATATPQTQTMGVPVPVPTTVPNVGVTYAPPGAITVLPNGNVFQPAPIIVSPAGSSSVAIGTVKDVQHALNTLGFSKPPLTEDGKLGPLTVACIKSFQSKNGLAVDGNAGPATKAALSAALTTMAGGLSAAGATAQNSNPQSGVATMPNGVTIDTKPALTMTIVRVQQILNLLGTSPKLTEDGKLGPKTVAAIKSFQTANGLVADGVAGAKTKTALFLAAAKK